MAYVLLYKYREIEANDPELLATIIKLVLINEKKALCFSPPSVLKGLEKVLESEKCASKFLRKIGNLRVLQKGFVKNKKVIYKRLRHEMPFGYYLPLLLAKKHMKRIYQTMSIIEERSLRGKKSKKIGRNFLDSDIKMTLTELTIEALSLKENKNSKPRSRN